MKTALGLLACASVMVSSLALAATDRVVETLHDGTSHRDLYAISVDPANNDSAIAVGGFGTILATTDGGESWKNYNFNTDKALTAVSTSGKRQIVVGQSGLILVREGDSEWAVPETDTTARLLGVGSNNDGLAFAVGQFGAVLKSTDGGKTWKSQNLDLANRVEGGYDPHLYDVFVSESGDATIVGEFGLIIRNAQKIAAEADGDDEAADEENGEQGQAAAINNSDDAQSENADNGDGAESQAAEAEKPAPAEAKGENVASEWEIINTADESLFSLQMRADDTGFAVGQSGTVMRTTDAGKNWSRLDVKLDANLLGVWSTPDGTVTVPGFRHMMVSDDNGETWRQVQNQDVNRGWYIDVAPLGSKPGVVAVGYNGRVIRIKKDTN